MKTTTLFQVRFRPSVKPPRGFTKSAHYNVTDVDGNEYLIGNTWLPAKDFIKIEVEDAPVFQKPILRKIASLKPDEVIECNTDAELKAVLEQAEREGLVWQAIDRKPTDKPPCIAPVCIGISDNENNCIGQISLESAKIEKYTILPASKLVEVGTEAKPELVEIDPPAPELKPFPERYVIPKGTRVVALTDGGYTETTCREGDVGTVVSERSTGGGYVQFDGRVKGGWAMRYKELAPLDPRDHPEHPEFGKQKQEEPITQAQKDECVKLQERIKELEEKLSQTEHVSELRNRMIGEMAVKNTKSQERIEELEALCELMLKDQEGLADEAESYREANAICISRIKRIENFAKAAIESNNDTLHKVALREIANGEI